MKYTKYFGLNTKVQGQINLPPDQFQRMMNIVHIEGVLFGLPKPKETCKNTTSYYNLLFKNMLKSLKQHL